MTAPLARPGTPPRSGAFLARPGRGSALLALCLAASTCAAGVGAVPLGEAAPGPALSRVVVSTAGAGAAGVSAAAAAVAAAGGTVLDHLPLVGGVSADLPAGSTLAPGLTVVPDRPVQLEQTSADLPADGPSSTVRQTIGMPAGPAGEGAGTTIAVIDTGVAPHPDLAGRLTSVDVSGSGKGDGYGHGTFVAGVAAGSGASSGGRYAGVAPGADVLDVRVADAEGGTDLVTVLRALEVARARGADVVNLSLSSYSPLPWQIDPLTVALTTMWEQGTVVVVPAGNDGDGPATITSPGVAPALLTVGALDEKDSAARHDDVVAGFSARGPAPQGVAKPELVAPGQSVVSLRAQGSLIDREHAAGRVGSSYFKGSGTSFSTAVAAGAAAVLRAERGVDPDQVKAMLMASAYDAPGLADPIGAGVGGLDVAAARIADAPAATPVCTAPGNSKKARACAAETGIPGTPGDWKHLLQALGKGKVDQAASSWSKLGPRVQDWLDDSWTALPQPLRDELTAEWAARNWAHASAEQWAARNWAARNWAARNWAASSWSARNWAASSWSGVDGWLFDWAARNWAARNWAARNWATDSWTARNWAARNWAADGWTARNWASDRWAARNWAAVAWGG